MTRWALIQGGIVANVVEQDSSPQLAGWWVECSEAGPGWTFSGEEFAAPAAPRLISNLAFLSRFTDAEAVAVDLASIGATVEAATLRRYTAKVDAAKHIDLDLPETVNGVQALEAVGLIEPGRAAEILGAQIQPSELP